ncbi:hypothetical protein LTR66_016411, partial [Elasticomyces elasticus]
QRQQQAYAFLRTQDLSRPSSSSGSASHVLRRTPNLDDQRRLRPRASSPDALSRSQHNVATADVPREGSDTRRATSARPSQALPHPALRISRRTASAILFTLEEAIRSPYPFTPDLVEENAQMSDLGGGLGGRAANGGARAAGGPVPVPHSSPAGVRTPREIMKERNAREARRQAEAEAARAEEQRRLQEEERRRSAERRAAAGVAQSRDSGGYRRSTASQASATGYGQAASQRDSLVDRLSGGGRVTSGGLPMEAVPMTGRTQEDPRIAVVSSSRPRATSVSQDQPRAAPAPSAAIPPAGRRVQHTQQGLRHSSAPASTSAQGGANPTAAPGSSQIPQRDGPSDNLRSRPNTASFPHAFERWEQLSSRWEGLTSYWIHRLEQSTAELGRESPTAQQMLEQSTAELGRESPTAQQMSRQITDLSAAGANLFHAVVELQRLRASSERKFQRWFFETKAEQERSAEVTAETGKMLEAERQARAEAVEQQHRADMESRSAKKMVDEMRRELLISKEEARRAWEELGRREQEERDRTSNLREGIPTVVGGVQVVPMQLGAGVSRRGSASQRPNTREGAQYQAGSGASQLAGERLAEEEQEYYEEGASPADTNPYTDSARDAPMLHHEPGVQSLAAGNYQPYPLGSTPATSGSTAQTAIPLSSQRQASAPASAPTQQQSARVPPATTRAQGQPEQQTSLPAHPPFYQHSTTETFLHSPHSSTQRAPVPAPTPITTGAAQAQDLRSEHSYVPSPPADDNTLSGSEGPTEYEIDEFGRQRLDALGRPIPWRGAGGGVVGDAIG